MKFSTISSALVAAFLAGAGPVWAQSETGTTAEDAAPVLQGELSTGAPVDAEGNRLGEPYTREVSGDWELRCVRTETPENDPCQLYQLLEDRSGNAVSEVTVFRLAASEGAVVAGATIVVPLETLLTAQLTLAIDGTNARRYPFSFCNTVGCFARLGLTQEDIDAFKRGAVAQVQIRPFAAPDQTVTVEMSLSGFTAGFDGITLVQNN